MDNLKYDYLLKVMLIGDSGVGKSCIMQNYYENTFTDNYISTIGVDFKIVNTLYNNLKIKLQIWDTAGQERFRSICASYYRGAHAIIIVYDVTDFDTFIDVVYWMEEIGKYSKNDVKIVLVGNKCDLTNQRAVNFEYAQTLANSYKIPFIETSAKTGINIDKTFEIILKNVMDNLKQKNKKQESNQSIKLIDSKNKNDYLDYCLC